MVVGVYDPASGLVRISNAGHEPPLHLMPDGHFDSFAAEAPPVGISPDLFPDGRFPEAEFDLADGSFYIFTDGMTEGRVDGAGALGIDGVKSLLIEFAELPVEERLGTCWPTNSSNRASPCTTT